MINYILLFLLLFFTPACNKNNQQEFNEQNKKTEIKISKITSINSALINKTKDSINIENIYINTTSNPTVDIELNANILTKDIENFIKIEPLVKSKIVQTNNHILLIGKFDINKKYTITLLKGLKTENSTLNKDISQEISFKDVEPKIIFSHQGIILPKTHENKIKFKGINIKKINLQVEQIFPNNTTQFLQDFSFKENGNVLDYSFKRNMYKLGDTILNEKYDIEHEKNTWFENEIDISNIIKNKGIYIIKLSFDKEDIDYTFPIDTPEWKKNHILKNNGEIGKAIIITNMAIIAQKEKNGKLTANIIDVNNNKAIKNVLVKAISVNNQLIDQKKTDKNGEVCFDNGDKIFYLLSETKNDLSLLKLDDSQLTYNESLTGGTLDNSKVKAFIYTNRGIYRPGDEVNMGIITRDTNSLLPISQDIKIDVFTPRGEKYINNKILKAGVDGKNGFFTFSFKTQKDDPTGLWNIIAYIDGQKDKKFSLQIPIESVVPHKIEVITNFNSQLDLKQQNEVSGVIKSNYLFGNPASNLKYMSSVKLKEKKLEFPQYKNFSFNNPTANTLYFNLNTKGNLNEKGEAKVKFKNLINTLPQNIELTGKIITKVIQENGRPVINVDKIETNNLNSYLGIESLKNNFIKAGTNLSLQVISIDSLGNLISGKKIKYRIYKNEYSWWWDYHSHDQFIKSFKKDKNTMLVYEGEFESSLKPYIINYEPNGTGEIYVEVEDLQTRQTAGTNLYINNWRNKPNNSINYLKISTDKKSYQIGEKAKITFEAEKGSRALITLSKSGKIIKKYWKDIENSINTIEIDVTPDLFPNGYINISTFQKYGSLPSDKIIRTYGAIPIIIDNNNQKLNLNIEAPTTLKPLQKFKIKVSNSTQEKMDYTISIVDEGLLGLTNFKISNPYDYFYQKQALQLATYDNYSEIIRKSSDNKVQAINPIKNYSLMDSNIKSKLNEFGFEKSERFKPLAIFKGVLTTSDDGIGETEIELPNYNGAIRIMVTAANQNKFGVAEKRIEVKSPIISNFSIPKVLKIGDKLEIPITIFALENNLENIKVDFKFEDKVQTKELNLKAGDSTKLYFNLEVGNRIGKHKAILKITSNSYSFQEEIDVDVISNTPYTYVNNSKFLKNGVLKLDIPTKYVENTFNGEIKISTTPILSIDHRVQKMIRYPYGSLEQIVSTAISQIYISKFSDIEKFNNQKLLKNINTAIEKLLSLQLSSGGFTYWKGQNEEAVWESIYAAEFMIMARENGYSIPNENYQLSLEYIKKLVNDNSALPDIKALGLYVLSLDNQVQIKELNSLYENDFSRLTDIGKWYLAGTYNNIGQNIIAKKIAKNLPLKIKKTKFQNYYNFTSQLQNEAIVLSIYYKIFGTVEENLYSNIINNLQSNRVLSSKTVGYSLLTLDKIKPKEIRKPLKAVLNIDGKKKFISSQDGVYTLALNEHTKNILLEGNELFINEYWEGIPIKYEPKNTNDNIIIQRKFYSEDGKEIDVTSLPIGSTFYIGIKIIPNEQEEYLNIKNISLTQILPSGWEIENLKALNLEYPKWISEKINLNNIKYIDIRDDRVNFFFNLNNYSQEDKQEFFVKVNAVTKGVYNFPDTFVESIDNPAYNGYLKGFKVKVD